MYRNRLKRNLSNKNYLNNSILSYLKMDSDGALLLTGAWGSGKTYFIKKTVISNVIAKTDFKPLMVSLYGLTDVKDIGGKLLSEYLDSIDKNNKNFIEYGKDFLKTISSSIKNANTENFLNITSDMVFNFLKNKGIFFIFDDIERVSETIKIDDLLGLVNELTENNSNKVLLVANEERFKEQTLYKEKTIDKTIYYFPNLKEIFLSLIETYKDKAFRDHLRINKKYIIETLRIILIYQSRENSKDLIANIRTLKFALGHYRCVFNIIKKRKNIPPKYKKKLLRNLWIFNLAISIEFREAGEINYFDRKNLDIYDHSNNFYEDSTAKGNHKNFEYAELFKDKYYTRLDEVFIFYPCIYDFITANKTIDKTEFNQNIEKVIHMDEGETVVSEEFLQDFLDNFKFYSNRKFIDKADELLKYAELGDFYNLSSFWKTFYFMERFLDILEVSAEELKKRIKRGLHNYLCRNYLNITDQLKKIKRIYKDTPSLDFIEHIEKIISILKNKKDEDKIFRVTTLLEKNIVEFVEYFIKEEKFILPETAFYDKIDKDKLEFAIMKASNKGISLINNLIYNRYVKNSDKELISQELEFLKAIESGVINVHDSKKTLKNYLLLELMKSIEKCRELIKTSY